MLDALARAVPTDAAGCFGDAQQLGDLAVGEAVEAQPGDLGLARLEAGDGGLDAAHEGLALHRLIEALGTREVLEGVVGDVEARPTRSVSVAFTSLVAAMIRNVTGCGMSIANFIARMKLTPATRVRHGAAGARAAGPREVMAMTTGTRHSRRIEGRAPIWFTDSGVRYATVPAWFGHVSRELCMDIIYPECEEGRRYPAIVWICGGAWRQMDRSAHLAYLADLARRGYVVASVDYRLSHEAPFPAQLIDIKAAVRWLRAHAARYRIDPERIGAMGESAGGYLTAMLAVTGQSRDYDEGEHLDQSSAVQAACPWYMPLLDRWEAASLEHELIVRLFLGRDPREDEAFAREVTPLSHLSAATPPFLLLHGDADQTVPVGDSERMHAALLAADLPSTLIVLEGAGHADHHFFQPELWAEIQAFFDARL